MNSPHSTTQTASVPGVYKYIPLLEKILVTALVIGVILTYMKVDKRVTMTALSGLATIYFFSAFRPPEAVATSEKFGFADLISQTILPKVCWLSCSITLLGIVFYLANMPGAKNMLMTGGAAIFAALMIFPFIAAKSGKDLAAVIFKAVPILIAGVYIFFYK